MQIRSLKDMVYIVLPLCMFRPNRTSYQANFEQKLKEDNIKKIGDSITITYNFFYVKTHLIVDRRRLVVEKCHRYKNSLSSGFVNNAYV